MQECITVLGRLGDGLAEAEWVAGPVVDDKGEVVRGDSTCDGGTTGADCGEGGGRAAVLEDDAEGGKLLVEGLQSGEEGRFRVEDGDGLALGSGGVGVGRGRRDFAVEVEDHVLFFHFGEDGVEGLVGDDAGGGVLWAGLEGVGG